MLFNKNIIYLRKSKNLSISQFSKEIAISTSSIRNYEKAKSFPRMNNLKRISDYFNYSMDDIVYKNIEEGEVEEKKEKIEGEHLRILPIVTNENNIEQITVVPQQASAGYLEGLADTEFISDLPVFNLPLIEMSENKTYRVFQIKGDSMLPVKSGSYIICEYLQNWNEILNEKTYVVVSKEDGIVYKRAEKKNNQFLKLISDNKEYMDYEVPYNEISEVWKAIGCISFFSK